MLTNRIMSDKSSEATYINYACPRCLEHFQSELTDKMVIHLKCKCKVSALFTQIDSINVMIEYSIPKDLKIPVDNIKNLDK